MKKLALLFLVATLAAPMWSCTSDEDPVIDNQKNTRQEEEQEEEVIDLLVGMSPLEVYFEADDVNVSKKINVRTGARYFKVGYERSEWFTVEEADDEGFFRITVTRANEVTEERSAEIKITAGNAPHAEVVLIQRAAPEPEEPEDVEYYLYFDTGNMWDYDRLFVRTPDVKWGRNEPFFYPIETNIPEEDIDVTIDVRYLITPWFDEPTFTTEEGQFGIRFEIPDAPTNFGRPYTATIIISSELVDTDPLKINIERPVLPYDPAWTGTWKFSAVDFVDFVADPSLPMPDRIQGGVPIEWTDQVFWEEETGYFYMDNFADQGYRYYLDVTANNLRFIRNYATGDEYNGKEILQSYGSIRTPYTGFTFTLGSTVGYSNLVVNPDVEKGYKYSGAPYGADNVITRPDTGETISVIAGSMTIHTALITVDLDPIVALGYFEMEQISQ